MNHPLQCQCGAVRGLLSHAGRGFRGVCYCRDCRAYSTHLGILSRTHDASGGADFVAALAHRVTISEGAQHLACTSLSPKGLLRWHTRCCNTPIGGTPRNWKIPYIGLVRAFMDSEPGAYERVFGDIRIRANTASATIKPPAQTLTTIASLGRFMPQLALGAITGAYKTTPFFNPAGEPVVMPTVLQGQVPLRG